MDYVVKKIRKTLNYRENENYIIYKIETILCKKVDFKWVNT